MRLNVQKQGRMQDLIDEKRVIVGAVSENRGRVGSTPPYSGGPSLTSQPLDRLSLLKFLLAFFIISLSQCFPTRVPQSIVRGSAREISE
jgi:hypothetical protein